MFADISVKQRLVLSFAFILTLIAVMVFLAARGCLETKKSIDLIANHLRPSYKSSVAISSAIDSECAYLRTFLQYGDSGAFAEYRRLHSSEQGNLRVLSSLLTPSERARLAPTEVLIESLYVDEGRAIEIAREESRSAAVRFFDSTIDSERRNASKQIEAFGMHYEAQVNANLSRVHLLFADLSRVSPFCMAIALIMAYVLVSAISKTVSRPTRSISAAAEAVSLGDYTKSHELEKDVAPIYGGEGYTPRNEFRRIALSVCRMARQMEKRDRTLSASASLARVCASTTDLPQLLDRFLVELAEFTGAQAAALYLYENEVLATAGTYGMDEESAGEASAEARGLCLQAVQNPQSVIISTIPPDTQFKIRPGFGEAIPKSIACIPIRMQGNVIGATVLATLHEFDESAVALMNTASDLVGIAINNTLHYMEMKKLADELQAKNYDLDARNEELLAQGEMLQLQKQEIQIQNAELAGQSKELQDRNLELEHLMHDLSTIQSLTVIALSSLSQKELVSRLLETVADALHLRFAVVKLLEEQTSTLQTWVTRNALDGEWADSAIGIDIAEEVRNTRQIVTRNDIWNGGTPSIDTGLRGLIGIPIMTHDQMYGVALLGANEARNFLEREKQVLHVFAGRAAVSIERHRSYDRLKQAEEQAQADRDRLQMIIDNAPEGVIIATAPDYKLYMANKAALSILSIDELPETTVEEFSSQIRFFRANGQLCFGEDSPMLRSLMHGQTCKGEELYIHRPTGEELAILCNTVPMKDKDGQVVGAIEIFQDITNLKNKEKALQAGYDHQRSIAETLQKVFLPRLADRIDSFDIADAYVPAGEDELIGGDFYDVFTISDGVLGIIIADVSGKGVKAAVYTAMAKYMIRGFASEDQEPASLLSRLNNSIGHYVQDEVFVTTFYGLLYTDERRLVYANAGHECPLVINHEANTVVTLASTGPAIGIMPGSTYFQKEIQLSESDTVVFYTDGITEARFNKEFFGREGLEATLMEIGDVASSDITEHLFKRVLEFSGGKLRDDAAMLVIKPIGRRALVN